MRFFKILFAVISIPLVTAAAAAGPTYTINDGEKLSSVPCDAWKRNADGSWTQVAAITMKPSGTTMSGNTFKGGGEQKELDAKCGAK